MNHDVNWFRTTGKGFCKVCGKGGAAHSLVRESCPGPGGPPSELSQYAYGYSNKKPGRVYWVIQIIMVLGALAILGGLIE